jgi:hypothetical protein
MNFMYRLRDHIHDGPKIRLVVFWVCIFIIHVLVGSIFMSWAGSLGVAAFLTGAYLFFTYTKGKYDGTVWCLLVVLLGIALLYKVFDDFVNTLIVAGGLFFIRAGLDGIMAELGNPDKKVMNIIANYFRKRHKGDEKNNENK